MTDARALVRFGAAGLSARAYGLVRTSLVERVPAYRALHAEVVDAVVAVSAGPHEHVRVLDLLCGPGSLTLALGAAGFRATGVEMFPSLLATARRRAVARGARLVDFAPLALTPGGGFDHVVNVHSLYAQPDPDALVTAARDALAPGGQAVFVNFARPALPWATTRRLVRRRGWRAAAGALPWLVPNALFEALRAPGAAHFWPEDELSRRLEAAGFRVLELRRTFIDGMSVLARAQRP